MRTTTFIFDQKETTFYLKPTGEFELDSALSYVHQHTYNIRCKTRVPGDDDWVGSRGVVGYVDVVRFNYAGLAVPANQEEYRNRLREESSADYQWKKMYEAFYIGVDLECDLLLIERVELSRKWRGYGIGRFAVEAVIAIHGQSAAVALNPYPLGSWGGRDREEGKSRLRAYWGQLGFQNTPAPGVSKENRGFMWVPDASMIPVRGEL